MKLPSINDFQLPVWPESTLDKWHQLTEEVRSGSQGAHSDRFKIKVDEIKNWLHQSGDPKKFYSFLKDRLSVRALTWLWLNDENVRQRTFQTGILNYITNTGAWLGRLTIIQLLSLYLKFYTRLSKLSNFSEGALIALKHLIKDQLAFFARRPHSKRNINVKTLFDAFVDHQDILLADNPVVETVDYANGKGLNLEELFEELGLKGFDTGDFAEQCRYIFYIKKLEELSDGEEDEVLIEVQRESVYAAPYDESKLLGHMVMSILIDKVKDAPSDSWLEVFMTIGGDPRISEQAKNYRKWWQPIGEKRVAKVRSWLAKEDLRLFLEAVEAYGKTANEEALQRMFPARKKFLEGLYEQGLIRNARLMLGSRAARFVDSSLSRENRISYISLKGSPDTAVIYLDCKDFYLIQGSHEFKIWLYLAKPTNIFDSYSTNKSLYRDDLTKGVVKTYNQMHPGLPYRDIVHHENTWRHGVISFLYKNGIKINLEKIMTPEDYHAYLQRYGYPVLSS